MSTSRLRAAAVAGSLALSLSTVSAPAAMAQDGPEATITAFMAAIEAKDFAALPTYFCDDQADALDVFDMSEMAASMPPGIDASLIFDAFNVFNIDTVESRRSRTTSATRRFGDPLSFHAPRELRLAARYVF